MPNDEEKNGDSTQKADPSSAGTSTSSTQTPPADTTGTSEKTAGATTAKAAKSAKSNKAAKPKTTTAKPAGNNNAGSKPASPGSDDKPTATVAAAANFAGVEVAEVLDFNALGNGRFIVVTTSGRKYNSTPDERKAQAAAAAAKAAEKAAAKAKAAQ
ncbi:hypothetical protein [Pseudohongiella acticola]|uniref:hypothetical protein n=1 Tax=Pseudohongiella acticola TaxID=1524254 RepID=UPI0030EE3490